jgi:hypothetical protein
MYIIVHDDDDENDDDDDDDTTSGTHNDGEFYSVERKMRGKLLTK